MTAERLQGLLQPSDASRADASALAYLNESFPSLASLSGLSDASTSAQSKSEALQQKLAESQSQINTLLSHTRSSVASIQVQASNYAGQYVELAEDLSDLSEQLLSINSHGERPPTLLEDLEASHRKLEELQNIREYVQVVHRALSLREGAIDQVKNRDTSSTISQSSLTTYLELQKFSKEVTEACSVVEDGSGKKVLHLITVLESLVQKTWTDIKSVLFDTLIEASESLKWPSIIEYSSISAENRGKFEKAFYDLINLQIQGNKLREPGQARPQTEQPEGPYPLEALMRPIAQRFKYHFDGSRETNKLDKPEWYFTHILNTAHDHRNFMNNVVQRLLGNTSFKHLDAWQEFIVLLLALPTRKLQRTVPAILSHPPLLAHTIYQALNFDAALVEEGFKYEATSLASHDKASSWPGLSDVILGKKEWFQVWLEAEHQFMEEQYHEIVTSSDAWTIAQDEEDDDKHSSFEIKPTNSARRIKNLVEQVTDRYSPLSNFGQKTRFLVTVQLPILEHYHGRIASSLTAFEGFSSALIRAVPGALSVSLGGQSDAAVKVDAARLTSGPEGLSRLCKAYVSAKYTQSAMDAWGEDVFFLELWAKINDNAQLKSQAKAASSLPSPEISPDSSAPEDTIFEQLISQYSQLAQRAETIIVQQVCGEVETRLKSHLGASSQSHSTDESTEDDIRISQTLLQPIALLSSDLKVVRSLLPDAVAVTLYRKIAFRLAEHLLHRQILYRGQIDLREGRETVAEAELWVETCSVAMGLSRSRAEVPWRNLLQASRLVGAENIESLVRAASTASDEDWGSMILDAVGIDEMARDEVLRVIQTRVDFHRS